MLKRRLPEYASEPHQMFERWQKVLGELFVLSLLPGAPKKCRRLINNRTKVVCLFLRISLILDNAYFNLAFEIKIVEIC